MIDQVGDLYARHYAKRAFQQIGYYDYDATSPFRWSTSSR